ncbi:inner membrane protein [Bryocella elongata]|uniref:Inner membrane protein n=1 Tax=Bryocella elongata TaxID=863522 RepID=A0A1H6BMG1_9BACT|nr:metal-dependent hydrolase [Bryocella elongata]SEG61597.1 inner membrane protein [Bryocella elongata]
MEPVTHILTGACLARTGLNRKAAYATLTMAIAAQFPDIDTLWSLRGPVAGFAHHRGITHTFVGIPFEAAFIVGGVWLLHRWRAARYEQRLTDAPPDSEPEFHHGDGRYTDERNVRPLTAAPVRWGLLYGFALLALLSHLLLDFTNNYGLRPFFPFDRHWYAGSIVFIFDPLIFLLLLAALILPWLFGLIGSEVGARRQPFRSRGWAIVALLGIVSYWGLRTFEHAHAVEMVMQQAVAVPVSASPAQTDATDTATDALNSTPAPAPPAPAPTFAAARRVLASPDPLSPFRWYTTGDYGSFYELDTADTLHGNLSGNGVARAKAQSTPQIRAALASPLGRVYIDWSSAPLLEQEQPDEAGRIAVTLTDLRFVGDIPFMNREGHSPLSGEIVLDRQNRVIDQSLDGRSAGGVLGDPLTGGLPR